MLLFFASNDIVVEIVKDRALIAVEMNRPSPLSESGLPCVRSHNKLGGFRFSSPLHTRGAALFFGRYFGNN